MTRSFTVLLLALVALLFLPPLLGAASYGGLALNLLFTAVLLASVYVATQSRRHLALGLALGALALLSRWLPYVADITIATTAADVVLIIFLIFVAWTVTAALARQREVDVDTVAGGITVYLLIGVVFAIGFGLVEALDGGAFHRPAGGPVSPEASARFPDLMYLSFVTMTTLGYGDMTPVSPAARSLAVAEAVLGQLFIAVFIARLVALYTTQDAEKGETQQ